MPHQAALIGMVSTRKNPQPPAHDEPDALAAEARRHAPHDHVHAERDGKDREPRAEDLADHVRAPPRAHRPEANAPVLHFAGHGVEVEQRDEQRAKPERGDEHHPERVGARGERLAGDGAVRGVEELLLGIVEVDPRGQMLPLHTVEPCEEHRHSSAPPATLITASRMPLTLRKLFWSSRAATRRISARGLTGGRTVAGRGPGRRASTKGMRRARVPGVARWHVWPCRRGSVKPARPGREQR